MEMDMSTTPKNSKITLAFVLKKYRTKHGWSRSELAAKVSVRECIIVALEEQNWKKLPTHSEVREALKRMCYVLDLKYYPVVSLYEQEHRSAFESKKSTVKDRITKVSVTDQTLKWGGAFLSCLIVVGYISSQVYTFAKGAEMSLDSPELFEYADGAQYQVTGMVDQGAQLTLNGQSVTLEPDGQFRVTLNLNPGPNPLEFQVEKGNTKTQTIQKTVYLK